MLLDDMSKQELRKQCDKLGIPWDKRVDSEDDLRAKIRKNAAPKDDDEEEAEPDTSVQNTWNLKARAALEVVVDKRAGTQSKRPVDCFGWIYDKAHNECKLCPHAIPCAKLTETAPLDSLNSKEAIEEPVLTKKEKGSLKLAEKTEVKLAFVGKDITVAGDLMPFYKLLRIRFGKNPTTVGQILDVFSELFEVTDRAALIPNLIGVMISNKEVTLI